MTAHKAEVDIRAEDRTAKLIMGMLVDCGVAFSYRRVPGSPMSAVVSVASRNGPTLLKVHDVVKDRLKRAEAYQGIAAQTGEQDTPKTSETLPNGYTIHSDSQTGTWFTVGTFISLPYHDRQLCVRAAIAHHEHTGGQ